MSQNNFLNETEVLRIKQDEMAWQEQLSNSFWSKFIDMPSVNAADAVKVIKKDGRVVQFESKDGMPVKKIRNLEAGQGAKFEFPFIKALQGKGIKGSSLKTLKDNAEKLDPFKFEIELEEYAHASSDKSPLGRKKVLFDVPDQMRIQMAAWGVRAFDELCFSAIETDPNASNILYPQEKTAVNQLTSDDKLTMSLLRKARVLARTRAKGIRYLTDGVLHKGKLFHFVVTPEDSFYDLKEDAEYRQSLMDAHVRGTFDSHPLFVGADAITHDGLVIYSSERAGVVANWGASQDTFGSKTTLFGANALCVAMGGVPGIRLDDDDFGRVIYAAFIMMAAFKKPIFDSIQYGSLQIRTSRSNTTGIDENLSDRVPL